jgi:hypothetical protein
MTRKTETVAHLDASIKRWKTRLKRSVTMIEKLEKKRKRLAAKPVEKVVVFEPDMIARKDVTMMDAQRAAADRVGGMIIDAGLSAGLTPAQTIGIRAGLTPAQNIGIDTDIPEFLRRGAAAQKAVDAVIADQIREEQAATKKAKASGRIAKMKAKKAGDLKKMPVSGKAALDLIRNG